MPKGYKQLTYPQKCVALALLREGKQTQKKVAEKFKVSERTIRNLVKKPK